MCRENIAMSADFIYQVAYYEIKASTSFKKLYARIMP